MLTVGSGKLRSPALSALAMRINAQTMEPEQFAKVKTLISELIERLLDEMKQDASKKGWCDRGVGVAVGERDARHADGLKLSAELTTLESKRTDLLEEMEELSKALKELTASLAEAAKLREEEKAENLQKLGTAKEGSAALGRAINVLKDYYMRAEHAKLSLAQRKRAPDAEPVSREALEEPELAFKGGEAYTGKNEESSNIITLLEEVKVDFERTIQDTEDAEAAAHAEFTEFERATQSAMSAKNTKMELNKQELEATEAKLKATIKELADLKPACHDIGMSYAERKKQREDEVDLLKKCVCLFDGKSAAECGLE